MEAYTPADAANCSTEGLTCHSAAEQGHQGGGMSYNTGQGGYGDYLVNQYAGHLATAGGYSPYPQYTSYAAAPMSVYPGDASRGDYSGITSVGGVTAEQSGTMPGAGTSAFFMPSGPYAAGAGGGQMAGDASMMPFQQSFGGAYPFYDTGNVGDGVALPQGMFSNYQALANGEPKKAMRKTPDHAEGKKNGRTGKTKKHFPCC